MLKANKSSIRFNEQLQMDMHKPKMHKSENVYFKNINNFIVIAVCYLLVKSIRSIFIGGCINICEHSVQLNSQK